MHYEISFMCNTKVNIPTPANRKSEVKREIKIIHGRRLQSSAKEFHLLIRL